jgi:hypothetical protein
LAIWLCINLSNRSLAFLEVPECRRLAVHANTSQDGLAGVILDAFDFDSNNSWCVWDGLRRLHEA